MLNLLFPRIRAFSLGDAASPKATGPSSRKRLDVKIIMAMTLMVVIAATAFVTALSAVV